MLFVSLDVNSPVFCFGLKVIRHLLVELVSLFCFALHFETALWKHTHTECTSLMSTSSSHKSLRPSYLMFTQSEQSLIGLSVMHFGGTVSQHTCDIDI